MKVVFCPTHDMLADFFTKPLQGALFACMRDKILNLPCSTSPAVHRSVLDLQNFSKVNKNDSVDGQESNGSENRTENTPSQKYDETEKDTQKDNEIMSNHKKPARSS